MKSVARFFESFHRKRLFYNPVILYIVLQVTSLHAYLSETLPSLGFGLAIDKFGLSKQLMDSILRTQGKKITI